MAKRKEAPPLPQQFVQLDEKLNFASTIPIIETDRIALYNVVLQEKTMAIAQLYKNIYKYKRSSPLTDDIRLIEAFTTHTLMIPYVNIHYSVLHKDGKDTGILFTPPPNTKRLIDLHTLYYVDRKEFEAVEDTLVHLPASLHIDGTILKDETLVYNTAHKPKKSGIQLMAITQGTYDSHWGYVTDVRKSFYTLKREYCAT